MPLILLKLPSVRCRRRLLTCTETIILHLLFFAHHLLASSPPNDYLSFTYTSFGPSNSGDFKFSTYASVGQGALQITPNTMSNLDFLANRSGRILLSRPIRLWQDLPNGKRAASFNTSFTMNMYGPSNTSLPRQGLAFLIAPKTGNPPNGSDGGFLGITNDATNDDNRIVAVEFDTVKQWYDPDDNHVGLDIFSIVSSVTASLAPFRNQIAMDEMVNCTVWIDYDGGRGGLRVHMALEGNPKPVTPLLSTMLNLSNHVNQDSYFGFAGATGAADYKLNSVYSWNLSVENLEGTGKKGGIWWKEAVGIAAGLVVFTAVVWMPVIWHSKKQRRRKKKTAVLAGTLKRLPGMPKEFEYKELWRATNGFEETMKLGQGGFGIVYKGVLSGEVAEVAVKKFSREDNMNSQNDFLKELTVINRLRHKHLVRLLGWCHEKGVLLLVYDYMPNGSLDQHLYSTPSAARPILPWNRRLQVAADVASALHYLHQEYDECVIHRDIKSSNVMLDADFHARLGDFGLARVIGANKTSYTELEAGGVAGTLGYIAPECFHTAKATRESDVFAFGALALELVCGRRPLSSLAGFHFIVDWVWMLHREGRITEAVDEKLEDEFDPDEASRLLLLGLACSHPLPGERPKAASIMQILSGAAPPPVVPAFKPAFMWPAVEPSDDGRGGRLSSASLLLTSRSLYATLNGVVDSAFREQGREG